MTASKNPFVWGAVILVKLQKQIPNRMFLIKFSPQSERDKSECILTIFSLTPLRTVLNYGRFAGIFAERPTEWSTMSNPGAGNQRFYNYVYMYM